MNEAERYAERLFDRVLYPLEHFHCPACGIRFGMELDDVRFMEQAEELVHCPRGHELRFGYPEDENA